MSDVKEAVLELARQLPNECTWDEVMYRIFVRQKIDAGLKDADAGRTISHDEVFEDDILAVVHAARQLRDHTEED